jgi:hypothetical protein
MRNTILIHTNIYTKRLTHTKLTNLCLPYFKFKIKLQ